VSLREAGVKRNEVTVSVVVARGLRKNLAKNDAIVTMLLSRVSLREAVEKRNEVTVAAAAAAVFVARGLRRNLAKNDVIVMMLLSRAFLRRAGWKRNEAVAVTGKSRRDLAKNDVVVTMLLSRVFLRRAGWKRNEANLVKNGAMVMMLPSIVSLRKARPEDQRVAAAAATSLNRPAKNLARNNMMVFVMMLLSRVSHRKERP
jgi:3-hydroxyisobutyrate dehydrogenase-like beta-hydroxyacid dehydrogenase